MYILTSNIDIWDIIFSWKYRSLVYFVQYNLFNENYNLEKKFLVILYSSRNFNKPLGRQWYILILIGLVQVLVLCTFYFVWAI